MMDRTKIAEQQHRLAKRIRAFHSKEFLTLAQRHNDGDNNDPGVRVNPLNLNEENLLDEDDDDGVVELDEEYEDEDDEDGGVDEAHDDDRSSSDEDNAEPLERIQLMMPSSVDRDDMVRMGLQVLVAQELEL